MGDRKFPSLRHPSSAPTDEWEADVKERLGAVLERLDPERAYQRRKAGEQGPTPDDWRRLAILLAIKHNEAGFSLDLGQGPARAAQADEIVRDDLMNKFLYGQLITEDGKSWLSLGETQIMTTTEAARKVHSWLSKEAKEGRYSGKIPTADAIRTQYSKRVSAAKRAGLSHLDSESPAHLLAYTAWRDTMMALERVSGAMTQLGRSNEEQ